MDLLSELIAVSEKAANVARLCRQNGHLFQLLVEKKSESEANPRFVDDFKTLADVLIQQLVKHDFPELAGHIFGEENNKFTNLLGECISVEIQENSGETANLLKNVLNGDEEAANLLAAEAHRNILWDKLKSKPTVEFQLNLQDLGIWIDPIDSTAEYINGIEEMSSGICLSGLQCVTVLIGVFEKSTGLPVLGVVNQPFANLDNTGWSGKCFWGHSLETNLPKTVKASTPTICVSSSEESQIVEKLKTSFKIVEASGAGYKILTVVTGLADAYVLTKDSTFKWDTCAPQAILRALGGDIMVYKSLGIEGKKVTYLGEDKCNRGGIVAYRNEEILQKIVDCLTTK